MNKYPLPPSLTYPVPGHRWFEFVPVPGCDLCHGYMHITQGVPGPRGGTKHIDEGAYFLQLHQPDFGEAVVWPDPVVMLLKEGDEAPPLLFGESGIELADENTPQILYAVTLSQTRGPLCNCTGFVTQHTCKHADAVYHLFAVAGWSP